MKSVDLVPCDMRSTPGGSTLGRDDLAVAVYRTMPGLTRKRARELVDEFFAEIIEALSEDRKVLLSGFGAFTIARKPDRPGRNPRTGEQHAIAARSIVRFKASRGLKAQVAGTAETDDAPAPAAMPRPRASSRRVDHSSPEASAAG